MPGFRLWEGTKYEWVYSRPTSAFSGVAPVPPVNTGAPLPAAPTPRLADTGTLFDGGASPVDDDPASVPPPVASISQTGKFLVFEGVSSPRYERAIGEIGGVRRRGLWQTSFARVFDVDAANEKLAADGYQPIQLGEDVVRAVTRPVAGYDGDLDSLKLVPTSELFLATHEYLSKSQAKAAAGRSLPERLSAMGIDSLYDLLMHVPIRHVDRAHPIPISHMLDGDQVTLVGVVESAEQNIVPSKSAGRRPRQDAVFKVRDDLGSRVRVTFFNQPWLVKQFFPGDSVIITGKVGFYRRDRAISGSTIDMSDNTVGAALVPVYPQSQKNAVDSSTLTGLILELLGRIRGVRSPGYMRLLSPDRAPLSFYDAIRFVHFPASKQVFEDALLTLAYNELVLLEVLLHRFRRFDERVGVQMSGGEREVARLRESLPFTMTRGQVEATRRLLESAADTRSHVSLLIGDVGSGKTLTASFPIVAAVASGRQVAVLAPTAILAEQLYESIRVSCERAGVSGRVALLDSRWSATSAERKRFNRDVADGVISVAVGTTGLLQKSVRFRSLGLVVVDEQQKFGVKDRSRLVEVCASDGVARPDVLMMTATPIPRATAQVLYGDVEVISLPDKPEGRLPIATSWVRRSTAHAIEPDSEFVTRALSEIRLGRRVFVVAPHVEGDDKGTVASVKPLFDALSKGAFKGVRCAMLHGKMRKDDQDKVMAAFRDGEYDVLVASPVVEVGIDVPDATVIGVFSADRIGVASLHQMRGRVGRNSYQSYCFLVADPDVMSERGVKRLEALVASDDGAALAYEDMAMRGGGDVFGESQKGKGRTRFSNILTQAPLLGDASDDASRILADESVGELAVAAAVELYGEYNGDML